MIKNLKNIYKIKSYVFISNIFSNQTEYKYGIFLALVSKSNTF